MAATSTSMKPAADATPGRAARGPYAKSEEVKQRIVGAATEVFAASGYHATTFKEIARRSGVSERGLVYHFPTKEALLTAVVDHHEQERSLMVMPALGLAALAALLAVVADDAKNPGLVELHSLLTGEATAPDHPAHDHYRSRYAGLRAYLAGAFDVALEDGDVTSDLRPDDLAAGLIALLDGLQIQWIYEQTAVDVERTADGYLAGVLSRDAMSSVRRLRSEFLRAADSGSTGGAV